MHVLNIIIFFSIGILKCIGLLSTFLLSLVKPNHDDSLMSPGNSSIPSFIPTVWHIIPGPKITSNLYFDFDIYLIFARLYL